MLEASMLTRRNFVTGAIATGVLLRTEAGFAKASQPSTAVNFDVPPHACDCHTHFYGDPMKFPPAPEHVSTPEGMKPEEMAALHRALHIERVVIVTPSVYGADNSATLYGMKARGANARGIAVVNDKTTDSEMDAMYRAGVRGARIIATATGLPDPAAARPIFAVAAARFKRHNWHIQIYANLALVSAIKDLVRLSPVPVVFDHFAGAQAALGLEQPGFADLHELVRSGSAHVKISAPYRSSAKGPDYPDMAPFAKALIEANPDRILWGTDWPHPLPPVLRGKPSDPTPLFQIDDGRLLNQLHVWAPDPAIRKKILVDNPARLYGF
jgi:predicted TIM-barrel fold metal-dependent hydrolase